MKDNWYVLFALVAKENKLCSVLRRKGLDAFIPKIEYYRRDIKGNTCYFQDIFLLEVK